MPGSIKSLYAQPIPDVSQVLPVSDSLLTPEEDVLRWRLEEEANRRQVTACRQPTVTRDQDEVRPERGVAVERKEVWAGVEVCCVSRSSV